MAHVPFHRVAGRRTPTAAPRARAFALNAAIHRLVGAARAAQRVGNWRLIGHYRLQISAMRARRNGLVARQAAAGKPWAVAMLRQIRLKQRMPKYRPVDLPQIAYSPLSTAYPRPTYSNWQSFVPGQKGAQVPSHLSGFGIGQLSPDDVEGVVEPIDDIDGWMDDLRMPDGPMARWAALGALGAFAFAAASKRKKQRQTATAVGLAATVATFWYGRKAVEEQATAGW